MREVRKIFLFVLLGSVLNPVLGADVAPLSVEAIEAFDGSLTQTSNSTGTFVLQVESVNSLNKDKRDDRANGGSVVHTPIQLGQPSSVSVGGTVDVPVKPSPVLE